ESGFVPLARGQWTEAVDVFEAALAVNRRSGYRSYEPLFMGFIGWAYRLAGDLDSALEVGRNAVEAARDASVWFRSAARSRLGSTLLAAGRVDEAYAMLSEGREIGRHAGSEAYLLRCLGPLAEATALRDPGSDQATLLAADCERRLASIAVPDGAA